MNDFVFLDKYNNLEEQKTVLQVQYGANLDELSKLSIKDDAESNRRRSHLIGQNTLLIAILSQ